MSQISQRILITGGAGFIGSHLVRALLQSDDTEVINLDNLTYAGHLYSLGSAQANPRHHLVVANVTDQLLLTRLFAVHQPTAVMHLAAETHVDRSIDQPAIFFDTNVNGTVSLLEAATRYWEKLPRAAQAEFRFLHVSTDEVFGEAAEGQEFNEETPYAPNSPYAASKAAADHFVRTYHRTYGLPVLITNSSNNFGPCQLPEKLIPLAIRKALAGEPIPVYGDGQQIRDWLSVQDHVQALQQILASGKIGETYLIGSGHQPTNLELLQQVCGLLDELSAELPVRPCAQLLTHVTDRPGHDRRYAVNAGKLRNELGWQPKHDFALALRETVHWYLTNPDWVAEAVAGLPSERVGLGKRNPEQ